MSSLLLRARLTAVFIPVAAAFVLACAPFIALANEEGDVSTAAEVPAAAAQADAPDISAEDDASAKSGESAVAEQPDVTSAPSAGDEPASDAPAGQVNAGAESVADEVPGDDVGVAEPIAPAEPAAAVSDVAVADPANPAGTALSEAVAPPAIEPVEQAAAVAPRQAAKPARKVSESEPVGDDTAVHPLADGTYALVWAKNKKQIAQSANNSQKAGANAVLDTDDDVTRQRWVVKYLPKYGYYKIVNEYSKRALAVASDKNKANVLQVKAKTGALEQLWSVEKVGRMYVFHPASNQKLALTGVSKKGGYDLSVRKNTSGTNQRFLAKSFALVHDGVYSLGFAKKASKVIGVPGYSMDEKKKLRLSTYIGDLGQKFQLKYEGSDLYTLQSLHSGKYLGVSGNSVVQASENTPAARQWHVVWNKTGLAFVNAKTGKRIQVPNATTKNGTKITATDPSNVIAQRFTLVERQVVDNGVYIVHTFAGNRALAVEGGSMAEFGNLDAETVGTGNSQKFRIAQVKNGIYKIVSLKSEMLAGAASKKSGANVRQRANHNSALQRWKARVAPNGGIQFVNVASGKVLDIAGTLDKSGANVRLAKADGTKEQRWWLEKTALNDNEAIVDTAMRKAQNKDSATNYFIAVDVKNHRTIIFKRSGNTWAVEKNWICSTGAPSTPTILGTYTVGIKGYSFGEGYTCYYYTQFCGDYLFHSVKYYEGQFKVMDGRLGEDVSEGCVRLKLKNAKWIYNNIPEGTKVVTYK